MLAGSLMTVLISLTTAAAACMDGDSETCHTKYGTRFGHDLLPSFMLAEGYFNLNHGSFGATPRPVMEAQRRYQEQMEARPDQWFRDDYFMCVNEAREAIAKYVKAPSTDDIVLVENASGGVNAVLRSMVWKEGDVVLFLSSAYPMVKNTAAWLGESNPSVQVKEVQLGSDWPATGGQAVLKPLREALAENKGKTKLVIVSHITSVPAVILPVEDIVRMCRLSGVAGGDVQVLVDGAHALGQVPIDLVGLGDPDYYISNGHKWLFSPKGSAFLYVRSVRQLSLSPEPNVISSSGKKDFVGRFSYTGSRDYTAFCAIKEAFKFRHHVGDEKIYEYTAGLARWAAKMLSRTWGTRVLVPLESQAFMINVQLPTNSTTVAMQLQERLKIDYDTYIVVANMSSLVYTRLSAQVLHLPCSPCLTLTPLRFTWSEKISSDWQLSSLPSSRN